MQQRDGYSRIIADAGLLLCLSLGALYAGARIGLTPKVPSGGVAVVFAPWTSADRVFERAVSAGARFIRFGAVPFVAVVLPDAEAYAGRMLDDGAWLVLDAQAAGGCSAANLPARKNS